MKARIRGPVLAVAPVEDGVGALDEDQFAGGLRLGAARRAGVRALLLGTHDLVQGGDQFPGLGVPELVVEPAVLHRRLAPGVHHRHPLLDPGENFGIDGEDHQLVGVVQGQQDDARPDGVPTDVRGISLGLKDLDQFRCHVVHVEEHGFDDDAVPAR